MNKLLTLLAICLVALSGCKEKGQPATSAQALEAEQPAIAGESNPLPKWGIKVKKHPLTDEKSALFALKSDPDWGDALLAFEYNNGTLIGYVTGDYDLLRSRKVSVTLRFGDEEPRGEEWVIAESALVPDPLALIREMSKHNALTFDDAIRSEPVLFEYDGMGAVIETLDRLEGERNKAQPE